MNTLAYKLKNLYPSTKFLYVILILVGSLVISDYRLIFSLVILNLFLAFLANVFKDVFKPLINFFIPLVLLIFILQSIFYPGENIIFNLGILSVRREGVEFSLLLISRILAIGTAFLLFFSMTPIKDYVYALEKSGMSPKASYIIMATMTIVPDLRKKADTIQDAQRSRGVEIEGNVIVRIKSMLPIIFPLIIGSIIETEEKVLTLESRAFSSKGERTSLYTLEKNISDKVISILLFIVIILVIVWRVL